MLGGFRGIMHNGVNYVFYDTAKQAGFKDVEWEPELQALSGETFKHTSANKDDEARSDLRRAWVLVSIATGIFRCHGFFAVRPKQPRQEPCKLLRDAREEEEARIFRAHSQRRTRRLHSTRSRDNWRYRTRGFYDAQAIGLETG